MCIFFRRLLFEKQLEMKVILVLLCVCVCCVNLTPLSTDRNIVWTGEHVDHTCHAKWAYDLVNSPHEITFRMRCNTTGWIGLGITKSGSMRNADIFFAWIDKDNTPILWDAHGPSSGNGAPIFDERQDLNLMEGVQEPDIGVEFTFTRALDTCDSQDVSITKGTASMIFAWGKSVPTNKDHLDKNDYHGFANRGHFHANLLSMNLALDIPLPNDSVTIELRGDNVLIPAEETTYWCTVFEINRADRLNGQKHHLIKTGLAMSGDKPSPFVHHLVLFRCAESLLPQNWNIDQESPGGELCQNFDAIGVSTTSPVVNKCQAAELVVVWAVGSNDYSLPEDIGYPMGEKEREVYMMQVHYNNPEMITGERDDSGVKMVLTPTLRPHEAGCLLQGTSAFFDFAIPPKQPNFLAKGICHRNCTQTALPKDGINVFAALLHTHTIGSKIKTRHVRNGKELEPLFQDDDYDFNFQNTLIRDVVKVLPGDEIITECRYNSMPRGNVTFGGLGTEEEMCFTFVYYYPRMEMTECSSDQPSMWSQANLLGYPSSSSLQGVNIDTLGQGNNYNEMLKWVEFLKSYSWPEDKTREYQTLISDGIREYSCRAEDYETSLLPDGNIPEKPPTISQPFVPAEQCSTTESTTQSGATTTTTTTAATLAATVFLTACILAITDCQH